MKVLITGANGFIGKNLQSLLLNRDDIEELMLYDQSNSFDELDNYCKHADCVFHLAAVLRPENIKEFDVNVDLTLRLMQYLKVHNNKCPVMFASSIQAVLDNPYGKCKRIEERKFIDYGKENDVNAYVFRFPNLFGTMSRPNYTSVIATFCYNTALGLPITVNNPAVQMKFAYIETVLDDVIRIVTGNLSDYANRILEVNNHYNVGLGELAYYMETLKRGVEPGIIREDDFYDKLKITYYWYALAGNNEGGQEC